jgi:hypothetical protein
MAISRAKTVFHPHDLTSKLLDSGTTPSQNRLIHYLMVRKTSSYFEREFVCG